MTRNTMTSWIEIADERQACEAAMYDRLTAAPTERQNLHLGSAILSLPSRIFGALSAHPATRENRNH